MSDEAPGNRVSVFETLDDFLDEEGIREAVTESAIASVNVWRPRQAIRPVAIGLLRDGDRLLVAEVRNDDGGLKGWRPLGGGIEFGETARDALRREFLEELGVDVEITGDPMIFENLYEHADHTGHEIIFAYPVQVADAAVRRHDRFQIDENSQAVWVEWVAIERFARGEVLFPLALGPLLVSR
jgi:ADP-ribose pyrophosphatase YjhB (NUDIX family)